jgi:hypothetical protein
MWRFKKNEDEDVCMAAAERIFLAIRISKGKKGSFLCEASINK